MFDLLKKKISSFISSVVKKEEKKEPEKIEEEFEEIKERKEIRVEEEPRKEPKEKTIKEKSKEKATKEKPGKEKELEKPEEKPKERKPEKKIKEKPKKKEEKKPKKEKPAPKPEEKKESVKKEVELEKPGRITKEKPKEEEPIKKEAELQKPKRITKEKPKEKEVKKEPKKDLEKKVKKGILSHVAEIFTGKIEIKEGEISELLDDLELGLLEGDVALSVAEELKENLKKRIVGKKVRKGKIGETIQEEFKSLIHELIDVPSKDLLSEIKQKEKPYKILVLGPNGSGKTTTIAKLVYLFNKNGFSVVVAAADTFRAAAIEQLKVHGERLNFKVVAGAYGADPSSIGFDGISHAKAKEIDVVIIDTAGRQDTNINLINELKKMDRVLKPDFKLYVGESIAGNAIVEQVSRFQTDIGMDGIILTKLDCDPKGGTVLSISHVSGVPIIYFGTGQLYEDLKAFDASEVADWLLS
ncbi:signal recognition particle-docking protein FtsY [Candidatus Micrarchaeota archaeon]|nr:signal recognition particle-docking protein FtsY [Candidatus Micrarchaeota archaeon]